MSENKLISKAANYIGFFKFYYLAWTWFDLTIHINNKSCPRERETVSFTHLTPDSQVSQVVKVSKGLLWLPASNISFLSLLTVVTNDFTSLKFSLFIRNLNNQIKPAQNDVGLM